MRYGLLHLPLLYKRVDMKQPVQNLDTVLFVGRRDTRKGYSLFSSKIFKHALMDAGFRIEFFPTKTSWSVEAKIDALMNAVAVLNIYDRPYNQSGVTGDSLSAGTPILFSRFEPLAEEISLNNLGVLISNVQDIDEIITALKICRKIKMNWGDKQSSFVSENFQQDAFDRFWLPYLR